MAYASSSPAHLQACYHGLPADGGHLLREDESFIRSGVTRKQEKHFSNACKESRSFPRIDLHGCNVPAAHSQLGDFLSRMLAAGERFVSIIHGQGHSSVSAPILRPKVRAWLAECENVLAYQQPRHNAGLVVVMLRQVRKQI